MWLIYYVYISTVTPSTVTQNNSQQSGRFYARSATVHIIGARWRAGRPAGRTQPLRGRASGRTSSVSWRSSSLAAVSRAAASSARLYRRLRQTFDSRVCELVSKCYKTKVRKVTGALTGGVSQKSSTHNRPTAMFGSDKQKTQLPQR